MSASFTEINRTNRPFLKSSNTKPLAEDLDNTVVTLIDEEADIYRARAKRKGISRNEYMRGLLLKAMWMEDETEAERIEQMRQLRAERIDTAVRSSFLAVLVFVSFLLGVDMRRPNKTTAIRPTIVRRTKEVEA